MTILQQFLLPCAISLFLWAVIVWAIVGFFG
jgi:hypothetical protein